MNPNDNNQGQVPAAPMGDVNQPAPVSDVPATPAAPVNPEPTPVDPGMGGGMPAPTGEQTPPAAPSDPTTNPGGTV